MIKDNMGKQKFNPTKLPKLKGHIKLTLRDAKTGHIDTVIEGDNIVSNAIRDIFALNYLGGLNYSSLMPLYQTWFGGILCYKEFHPTDAETGALNPDDYFPKSDEHNKLTAHAGNVSPSDIADDSRRGSPNTNLTQIKEHSIKLGWEWGTTQGNGPISAISLTHRDTGNAGLGSASTAFAEFQPFANIGQLSNFSAHITSVGNTMAQYDESNAITFYLDGYRWSHTTFSTNRVTVHIRRLAYEKAGLFDTTYPYDLSYTDFTRSFTVTTSTTFWCNPSYWFDRENKKLWLFTNLKESGTVSGTYYANAFYTNKILYEIIPCPLSYDEEKEYAVGEFTYHAGTLYKCTSATSGEFDETAWTDTFTFEHGAIDCEQSANDFAPVCSDYPIGTSRDYDQPCYFAIPRIGNYFYFPTTLLTPTASGGDTIVKIQYANSWRVNGVRKINALNHADQTKITLDGELNRWDSAMVTGDFVIKAGMVCNGTNGYTCYYDTTNNFLTQDNMTRNYCANFFNQTDKISAYVVPLMGDNANTRPRWIVANKMVNTTLFNLVDPETGDPTTITKQGTQAMTIEYTITEIPEEPAPEEEEE